MKPLNDEKVTQAVGGMVNAKQLAERLGNMLLKLPAVSLVAGHSWPRDTVRDYYRPEHGDTPEERLAARLFFAILTRRTEEIIDTWYNKMDAIKWASTAMEGMNGDPPEVRESPHVQK